jgi:hypothetical protein
MAKGFPDAGPFPYDLINSTVNYLNTNHLETARKSHSASAVESVHGCRIIPSLSCSVTYARKNDIKRSLATV